MTNRTPDMLSAYTDSTNRSPGVLSRYTDSTKRTPDVIHRARNMTSGSLFAESWLWEVPVDSIFQQFVQLSHASAVDLAIAHLVDEDGDGLSALAHQQVVEVIAHGFADRVGVMIDDLVRSSRLAELSQLGIVYAVLLDTLFPLLENHVLRSSLDAVTDAVEHHTSEAWLGADEKILNTVALTHAETERGHLLDIAFEAELSVGLDKDRVDRTRMRSLHWDEIEAGAVIAIGWEGSLDDEVAWGDICFLCVFF